MASVVAGCCVTSYRDKVQVIGIERTHSQVPPHRVQHARAFVVFKTNAVPHALGDAAEGVVQRQFRLLAFCHIQILPLHNTSYQRGTKLLAGPG